MALVNPKMLLFGGDSHLVTSTPDRSGAVWIVRGVRGGRVAVRVLHVGEEGAEGGVIAGAELAVEHELGRGRLSQNVIVLVASDEVDEGSFEHGSEIQLSNYTDLRLQMSSMLFYVL